MMIDKKPHLLRFLSIQPQTFADIFSNDGTVMGVVAGLRLADIVQQQREP